MTVPHPSGPQAPSARGGRLRRRAAARRGLTPPPNLVGGTLTVHDRPRTFWVAAASTRPAPLLIVLHGAGGTGPGMAALCGLAERAPMAGVATVYPDGWNHVWNDNRGAPQLRQREGIDDVAFLQALVGHLVAAGVADPHHVSVAGISNGAFMAERVGRHGLLDLDVIGLVAGSASQASRSQQPRPARPATVIAFSGTADPLVPYEGGTIGWSRRADDRRRAPRTNSDRGQAVPIETALADWVAADELPTTPVVEPYASRSGLWITRSTWSSPGSHAVVLHRIEGGGHTWPGGPSYLPSRVIGPVAPDLDASGILLSAVMAAAR